jgi:Ni/Co efflux regulator RcnB
MKSKLILAMLLFSPVLFNLAACQNDEIASNKNKEDSLQLVLMQERLNTMERELAARNQEGNSGTVVQSGTSPTPNETVNEGTSGTNYKPNKKYQEPVKKTPKAGNNFFAKDMGNYPEGSNRILTERDIQHISHWGYALMVNEIYARHGMSFNDKPLQDHFNNQNWYKTGRKNVDKSLSSIEKQNIEFLKKNPK